MISMTHLRRVFRDKSVLEARRSTMKRRAQVALRPIGENLEGRALMASLGLDPTFGFGGAAYLSNPTDTATLSYTSTIYNETLQSDGKIIVVGDRQVSDSSPGGITTHDTLVERLNPDGSLDTSFGSNGVVVFTPQSAGANVDSHAVAVAVQSDGKIVILADAGPRALAPPPAGYLSHQEFAAIRLTATGGADSSFNSTGYNLFSFETAAGPNEYASSIALAPGGAIVVAGTTWVTTAPASYDFAVARLTTGGVLDTSFNSTGEQTVGFNLGGANTDTANSVAVQTDGKIVVVGSAQVTNGLTTSYDIAVSRLNVNGTLDNSFNNNGKLTIAYDLGGINNDYGNAVLLSGNVIAIAGTSDLPNAASGNQVTTATLTRLSTTGAISAKTSLSLSQQGVSFQTTGLTLSQLADGSLLLGGNAQSLNNNAAFGAFFTKFFAVGGIDTSYGTGGTAILPVGMDIKTNPLTFNDLSGAVLVQPDGKLVFAGDGGISRTTAPAPVVVTAQLVMPNTKQNARSNTIVLHFNTTLNPTLANNKKSYLIKVGKRGRPSANMIRKVSYDAATQNVTITLRQRFNRRAKLFVVVNPVGLASLDSQFVNNGQNVTIPITVV